MYVDQDYIDILSDKDKDFLSRFNEEYYKGQISKSDPNVLHNTDILRHDCYNRKYRIRHDTYSISCALNLMEQLSEE